MDNKNRLTIAEFLADQIKELLEDYPEVNKTAIAMVGELQRCLEECTRLDSEGNRI